MEGKQQLLAALAKCSVDDDFEDLESLLGLHASRSADFNLQEIADFMTESEHESLWQTLCRFSTVLIEALQMDEENEDGEEGGKVEGAEEIVASLRRIAGVMTLYVVDLPKCRPASLLDTLQTLHDTLMALNDDIPGATLFKNAVARCCESWWVKEEAGAENVCNQLIPYLLLSALGPAILDADVKRCFAIRGALLLLDFEDSSIDQLKGLLLRCVIHPGFLKVSEGRRFLSFLFSISSSLAPLIVSVMKPQIAAGMKGVASAYGEVLYRAWKDSESSSQTSGIQPAIEECIQRLAHDTIHASDRKYFLGLRFVLGAFHENKRIKGVDTMLLRVYGPILWRSLRCANALVRAQATMLFFDAFPLQDSDASTVESDTVLQKQFDLLSSLIKDVDHRVRAAAVSGVLHILGEFWEAVPLQTTKHILSYVVGTLGHDASCSEVRLVVVQGLCGLLDQPLAHGVLSGLLPLLANAIHDNAEKVRVAFIQMLDKVKNIKGITFYDIVPEDKLFARLAEDAARPAVASALTKLLLNSFYPREENGSGSMQMNQEQKSRCKTFISMNPQAAVAFYSHLHRFVSMGSVAKFCSIMFATLSQSASSGQTQTSNQQIASNDDDDDDGPAPSHPLAARAKRRRNQEVAKRSDTNERSMAPKDTMDRAMRVGILRVVLSCFSSVSDKIKMDIHKPSRDFLAKYFTADAITEVFRIVAPGEAEADVESLPVLLKFIALVNEVMAVDDAAAAKDNKTRKEGEEEKKPPETLQRPSMLSFSSVMASFSAAWGNLSTDDSLDDASRGAKFEQQAMACVDVLCVLGKTDDLLEAIRGPFRSLEKSLLAARSKSAASKKAEAEEALPLGAAVELLSALASSCEGSTYTAKIQLLSGSSDFFSSIFSVVQKAAKDMAFKSLGRAETFTVKQLLRCIHLNASIAVTKLTLEAKDTSSLEDFVVWMSANIVGINDSTEKFNQLATASVLALFSDCLALNVATDLICTALESWSGALLEHLSEGNTLPFLVPILGRLCLFAYSKRKDGKTFVTDHSNAFAGLLQILVQHLAAVGSDAGEESAASSSPAKKFVDIVLASGSTSALACAMRFVLSKVTLVKKRSVTKLKIEDDNAIICLDMLSGGSQVTAACEYAREHLLPTAENETIALITELFNSAKCRPAIQKQIFDSLSQIDLAATDKENASENVKTAHVKLLKALVQPVSSSSSLSSAEEVMV